MKKRTKKHEKGITLIALTITIVVMLILAGVAIDVIIDGKLFDNAKTAVNKSNDKVAQVEDEASGLMGTFDEKIEKQEEQERELLQGTRMTANTEYKDANGKIAIIPKGFTLSGIPSEQTVDAGLVIYDIPASAVMSIDWDNPDSVKTKYNQFVWIPVENIGNFVSQYEPATNGYAEEAADYATARASVEKNGGFYIGRYEAGTTAKRTKTSGVTDVIVVQDAYPYNYVLWGTSVSDIGTVGAVYLSRQLYTGKTGYGVTSQLVNGSAWNSTMSFVNSIDRNVADSKNWGNYSQTWNVLKIKRGHCYIKTNKNWRPFSYWLDLFPDGGIVSGQDNVLLTTGATEQYCAKNIYDLAGNCHEWGLRGTYQSTARAIFGGGCDDLKWFKGTSANYVGSCTLSSSATVGDDNYCIRI